MCRKGAIIVMYIILTAHAPPLRNIYKSGQNAKMFKPHKQIKKIASLLLIILSKIMCLVKGVYKKIKLVSMAPTF